MGPRSVRAPCIPLSILSGLRRSDTGKGNHMEFLHDNMVVIMGCLLGISEVLALVPGIKSNSIFQLIVNLIKSAAGK